MDMLIEPPIPPAPLTLISLLMERMRRRESSERSTIPSMQLYSSSCTYAPMSARRKEGAGGRGRGECSAGRARGLPLSTAYSRKAVPQAIG